MSKFVKGSYTSVSEAESAIDGLVAEGYSKTDITLVTNKDMSSSVENEGVDVKTDTDTNREDESFWEKIKNVFTVKDYDESDDVLAGYQDDIAKGNIVLLVDGDENRENTLDMDNDTTMTPPIAGVNEPVGTTDFVNPAMGADSSLGVNPSLNAAAGTMGTDDTPLPDDTDLEAADLTAAPLTDVEDHAGHTNEDKEKIRLQKEKLDVHTNEVQTGEVHVDKKVTEETQTVDVPVKHDEITVERHPVAEGETAAGEADLKDESFTIPVKEEQIEVHKRPVVTEEVEIEKETKENMKQVSETVRKEDLDIHTDGDVEIEDNDKKPTDRP
ncbi:MAG: YsnF/AvaK domain-containing protein [Carnobacterium sp.]|uniref:YsnF/AvaK domain-containing protein n=1 Tax=Carnobacterium sp. TaxID=48221 RepID=UPI002FC90373